MQKVELLTKDDVKDAVREILLEELPAVLKSLYGIESATPKFLDKKQTADFLRVSKGTVDNLRRKGQLTNTQMKGVNKVLFKHSDILDYVKSSDNS